MDPDVARLRVVGASRWARFLSTAAHPTIVIPTVLCWAAVADEPHLRGVARGVSASALAVGGPVLAVRVLHQRAMVYDTDLLRRDDRHVPHAVALLTLIPLLWPGTAATSHCSHRRPRLRAALAAQATGVALMAGLTTFSKPSHHVAVAVAAVQTLRSEHRGHPVIPWLAAVAMGVARVRLGRHSMSQVVMGGAVGALVGGPVYRGFRGLHRRQ